MMMEKTQAQIEALHERVADLNGVVSDDPAIVELLREMSTVTDELLGANAEVERRLLLQYAVMRALTESIGTNEAYNKVLQAVCEVTGGELGMLWIYDIHTERLHVASIWQEHENVCGELAAASEKISLSPGEGLPGKVYKNNKPLWVSDVVKHPAFHSSRRDAAIKNGINTVLMFPIRKEGGVMGVVECFSEQSEEPVAALMDVLDALGNQIGGFIERKQAEDLLSVRVRQQAVVAQIGQRALLGMELQELFDQASALVATTLEVEFSKVLELIPDQGYLLLRAGVGWKEGRVGHTHLDVGPHSQGGYSLSTNNPVIVSNLAKETRFKPSSILVEHDIVSGLSVIIPGSTDRPFGILSAHSATRRVFIKDDVYFLQAVAHVLAAAIQRQEIEEALRLSRNEIAIILDGITDGITAQNAIGKLIYANDSAARIIGYASADELLNTSIEDVVMPRFEMFDEQDSPLSVDQLPGRLALLGQTTDPMAIRFRVLATGEERWSLVKAKPVLHEDGQVVMVVNIFQDITDLKRTEMAQRLLAQASAILDTSLDYETRLIRLAEMIVPRLADWCSVDILDENQVLQRVVAMHIDPEKVKWAHELHRRYPPNPEAKTGVYAVIRNNKTAYTPVITKEMLDAAPMTPEQRDIVDTIGFSSIIQVPLFVRGRSIGALSLVWAESGRHYTPADVALAEDLAHRAAMALDNARLYLEAQRLNTDLEQRVEKRTQQLQRSNLRLKKQVKERRLAEEQILKLNAELEQRVAERTNQLELMNRELQHEVIEREQTDQALQAALRRTRELYEISQEISMVRLPDEVMRVLLSSSYLQLAVRASIAIFDPISQEDGAPSPFCTILAEWNKSNTMPTFEGRRVPLAEYGLVEFYSRYEPLILADIRSDARIDAISRQRLLEMGVGSSVIFPMVAGGERYGLLSLHFGHFGALNAEDVRYLRGLVDQAAIAIHNFRLLEAEAKARQEAEEANNLKLKFLAMISHELRTPLTSIKGFATTLLAEDVQWQPESQRDFLETIDAEADKLTDLIEQLLDLSRLEAGTMRILPQCVSWDEILLMATAQLYALTPNHLLILQSQPDLPLLKVDVIRVPQVLTNLVNNAVKYSPQNSPITISAVWISDDFVKISVSDQGFGIPPEARSRVFEPFQQLERERAGMKGAGLGLAICRGLIEAHDGRIWVDAHEGPGTTISFTLPVA